MNQQQFTGREEQFIRRYVYDDGWVIAVALDVFDDQVDVDVVGSTVILVQDDGRSVSETEFELPGAIGSVEVNNGVLTISGTN